MPFRGYIVRMIPLVEARALIADKITPRLPVRTALSKALGRVLGEPVVADADSPAFDRSAMDGYAISAEDRSERFRVVGEVQPGAPPELAIGVAECVRIFTGAQIPEGSSQVIMQEETRREGEWMIPTQRSAAKHIRRRGEEMKRGAVVLEPGGRLGAGELSLLAQLGRVEPLVSPAPLVLHVTTGRELVDPASVPGPGEIRDTNSTLIAALLQSSGAELAAQLRCGDSLEALVGAVRSAEAESWDLLLISGGASVGDYDFGARALGALGFEIHFSKLNLRPGKPLLFATRGPQAAFVIPGNPVSHFILYHVAVRVALDRLEGAPVVWRSLEAALAEPVEISGDPREVYWPARLEFAEGLRARQLKWRSSGDLTGLVGADALLQIPPRTGPYATGDRLQCILL
jgi:molybdopterin molybdotransferase